MADSKTLKLMLLKCSAILIVSAISFAALLFATFKMEQDSYLAAVFDKVKILESMPSPKIIFVGGSGLAFGLDSAKIEQACHRPVINMGVQAGFGLKNLLEQVKPFLKRDDIVVIVPEYEHFVGNLFYSPEALIHLSLITHNWRALGDIPTIQLANSLLKMNSVIFFYSPWAKPQHPYVRSGFNRYGDMTAHLDLPDREFCKTGKIDSTINKESMQFLHDFIRTNAEQGIATLVIYPCLAQTFYNHNVNTITDIADAFRENDIQILSTPLDSVYDDNLFFDTPYHLNKRGRENRTIEIIQVLKNALPDLTVVPASPGH